mmetsp:Transcript_26966/g.68578  ORF Transcript_26966/g.68578 Transcript_26966/m.68578 type:complete len:435 (+) Transcript_26966:139-1443(+)
MRRMRTELLTQPSHGPFSSGLHAREGSRMPVHPLVLVAGRVPTLVHHREDPHGLGRHLDREGGAQRAHLLAAQLVPEQGVSQDGRNGNHHHLRDRRVGGVRQHNYDVHHPVCQPHERHQLLGEEHAIVADPQGPLLLADADQLARVGQHVVAIILHLVPGERRTVQWVLAARQADLVAVVDQRGAGPGELQRLRELAHDQVWQLRSQARHVVVADDDPASQDLLDARVLDHALQRLRRRRPGARAVGQAVYQHPEVQAEDRVHRGGPARSVGPDLADDEAAALVAVRRARRRGQQLKAEFRGHVEPPAVRAALQPRRDDRVLACPDVLLQLLVLQARLREGGGAAPHLVAVGLELVSDEEPFTLLGAGVLHCFLEDDVPGAHVVEDAVQHELHPYIVHLVHQRLEVLVRAVLRVEFHVVARVVLVVRESLRDGL